MTEQRTETLILRRAGPRLDITLHRPQARNAMSFVMLDELEAAIALAAGDPDVRVIVLRGAGGDLCAGGDVKDMAAARVGPERDAQGDDPLALANRRFGRLLQAVEAAPQAVIAVAEGAVMGGGVGLVCAADIALALPSARVRLPETGLGITPAQIMPFVARRVGASHARRLAVTGGELGATRALEIGLVHELVADEPALEAALRTLTAQVVRCAPGALARTKRLVLEVSGAGLDALLDRAAADFAAAARGEEGVEGMLAFMEKRAPRWAAGGTSQ